MKKHPRKRIDNKAELLPTKTASSIGALIFVCLQIGPLSPNFAGAGSGETIANENPGCCKKRGPVWASESGFSR